MNIDEIDIDLIEPNRDQPRTDFNEERLKELMESIKKSGIIQPIVLARRGEGYRIVAGERRWRAAMGLGMKTIPAVVRSLDTEKEMELSIVENIQREDLNPIEEALSFKRYLDYTGKTQDELSLALGKSRSYISNTMRLLKLPEDIICSIRCGDISAGHGRTLLSIEDSDMQMELYRRVLTEKLSVRELEKCVSNINTKRAKKTEKDIYTVELERELSSKLGQKVTIKSGKNKGKIEIEYYSGEELETIVDMLSR